jgi:hypothetical protein
MKLKFVTNCDEDMGRGVNGVSIIPDLRYAQYVHVVSRGMKIHSRHQTDSQRYAFGFPPVLEWLSLGPM